MAGANGNSTGMPLRRATVTRVESFGVFCSISTLGTPKAEFGPMDSGYFDLRVGDKVIVGQAGFETENFVVITSLAPRPMPFLSMYYFETTAERDVILPAPLVPTFAYVDDDQTIYIYSDEGSPSWRKVNWGINGTFADALTFSGAVTLTQDTTANGKVTITDNTKQFNAGSSGSAAAFASRRPTAADLALGSRVVGDSVDRFQIAADGKYSWGPGAATAVDTTLYRNGVGTLKTDGIMQVGGALSSASLSTGAITATSITPEIIPFNNLSDVTISAPAAGQVPRYSGTAWVNTKLAVSDHSDVTLTSIAANQALVWNGSAWVNRSLPLGVIWNHIVSTATTFASNFNVDTDWYSTSSPIILANRTYRLTQRVVVFTGGGAQIKVRGYIKVNGTQILETGAVVVGADSSSVTMLVTGTWNTGASPGTPTFAVGAGRLQGLQNFDMVAQTTNWAEFIIEDLGPVRSD